MKIYTKTGDTGQTGLFAGERTDKDDPRIEAYGTVDELNAALGLARSLSLPTDIDRAIEQIQHTLFAIGAELATPDPERNKTRLLVPENITALEKWIDDWEDRLPPLTQFILPMGTSGASGLHLARAVCRRAERRVVTLKKVAREPISDAIIVYLNRLGDFLFVASRFANHVSHYSDMNWRKPEVR